MSTEYEVTVRLKAEFPRDINMEGEVYWWTGTEIADEISSWLEDLGFNVQVTVKEVSQNEIR
jgi:hypothetical protein